MFKTLRAKLLAFFLFATFIPMMIISYITYDSQKEDIEVQMSQTMISFANSLAVILEDLIQERLTDVAMLAQNPILRNSEQPYSVIEQEIDHFVQNYNLYLGAVFVNESGIVVADVDHTVVGTDLSTREWFQETIDGGIFFSDIYLSPVVHRPMLVLSSAVRDENGEIIGVVSPSFDLGYLWLRLDNFTKQQQLLGLDGYAFLVNGQGDIIAHPNQELILNYNYLERNNLTAEQFEQSMLKRELIHSESNDMLQTFVKVANMPGFEQDWYVGISIPRENLTTPLRDLAFKYLFMFGLIFLVTLYAVFKLSAYIVQPLQRLVNATSDFAFGKRVYPLAPDAYHEVDTLTKTFNMMTRKLVEREKSHQKSTLILETTDNGIIAFNRDSLQITTFNRTCEQLFQKNKSEVLGMTITQFREKSSIFHSFIKSTRLEELLSLNDRTKQFEFPCNINGIERIYFMSISTLPKLDNEQELEDILLIFNDVTDKRQMEQELIRTEKLKVVGQLAAGFAHEIRNPLTTIRGFLQLVHQSEEISHKRKKHFDIMLKEIDRVNGIISELLNMANPKAAMVKSVVDVAELIKEKEMLYTGEAEANKITFKTIVEPLPLIFSDGQKLDQAIINLIKNSFEAMPDGGVLTIRAREFAASDVIKIDIADTGCGMSEETLDKLGTPFYTTKEMGTGLGMMTTFRIIEEMGGSLSVKSELGKGTTFTITLPLERVDVS
ncbi:PAS domain-containing sensor histidine kinase [Halalkalibacter nanhaiisediminis]|uniref:histidine kinase n=1 Tax=Halalkalibacter nanhaiisediminis TaxID=688079 RepID=A0A562QHQ1_9BACI|nr:PAS domain-containing sensor histidine kinase [Halalkalibacter nanhaiisediminis]TWI56288.1 HAMP domain-containing protein [Halalkalibacter nanhaiisediminis]